MLGCGKYCNAWAAIEDIREGTTEEMAPKREEFDLSGPVHLTAIDWTDETHQRSVAASLVQGVYTVELYRQKKRKCPEALASPWWEFFHFKLLKWLVDIADSCIFGAIYEFKPPSSHSEISTEGPPKCVIAFRGNLTKLGSIKRDFELDIRFIRNGLHSTSRFEIAMKAVRNRVAAVGGSNVWLAGHSLGAAMAMLAGKTMAKTGIFVESFLFNPPFFSFPIEGIKDEKVKDWIRIVASVITAGLTIANVNTSPRSHQFNDQFTTLSAWLPRLFINPADHLCSEYIGYFEHRKKMEKIGAGSIEELATQNSLISQLLNAIAKQPQDQEPLHLIPSANLTVNLTPSRDLKEPHGIRQFLSHFKEVHGIHQWWSPNCVVTSRKFMEFTNGGVLTCTSNPSSTTTLFGRA